MNTKRVNTQNMVIPLANERVTEGVRVFGAVSGHGGFSSSRLRADARRILSGEADAIAYSPFGIGQQVLAVETEVVLVRESLIESEAARAILADRTDLENLGEVGGWSALLELQWQISLRGARVIALEGAAPTATRDVHERIARRRSLLAMAQTNFSRDWRAVILPWMQLSMVSGDIREAGVDSSALDLQCHPGNDEVGTLGIPASALAGALALDQAAEDLPNLVERRARVQAWRRLPDRSLADLYADFLSLLVTGGTPDQSETADSLRGLFGIDSLLTEPVHVLVERTSTPHSQEVFKWLTSSSLSSVMALDKEELRDPSRRISALNWADVLVVTDSDSATTVFVDPVDTAVVAHLASAEVWEHLRKEKPSCAAGQELERLCSRADLVLVDDLRFRDMLLGALAGAHRVNDVVYDADPSLATLVSVDSDGQELVRFCGSPLRAVDRELAASDEIAEGVDGSEKLKTLPRRALRRLMRVVRGLAGAGTVHHAHGLGGLRNAD